jgi:hypothetical protein
MTRSESHPAYRLLASGPSRCGRSTCGPARRTVGPRRRSRRSGPAAGRQTGMVNPRPPLDAPALLPGDIPARPRFQPCDRVCRNHEQCPPHGVDPAERTIVEQGTVEVGRGEVRDTGHRSKVGGCRVARVQRAQRARRVEDISRGAAQMMPRNEAGTPLGVADMKWLGHRGLSIRGSPVRRTGRGTTRIRRGEED